MVFQWIFDGFLMGFKFWVAAPGGFFENPTIFGSFGLKIQENSRKKFKIFEKSKKFRKISHGPPRVSQGPPRGHGKFFEKKIDFSKNIFFFFKIFTLGNSQ